MPKDQLVSIPSKRWIQLTDSDVTAITFQIQKGPLRLKVTSGADPDSNSSDGLLFGPTMGEVSVTLASLAPGVTGGKRVFVWSDLANSVWVSHA